MNKPIEFCFSGDANSINRIDKIKGLLNSIRDFKIDENKESELSSDYSIATHKGIVELFQTLSGKLAKCDLYRFPPAQIDIISTFSDEVHNALRVRSGLADGGNLEQLGQALPATLRPLLSR